MNYSEAVPIFVGITLNSIILLKVHHRPHLNAREREGRWKVPNLESLENNNRFRLQAIKFMALTATERHRETVRVFGGIVGGKGMWWWENSNYVVLDV